jgi:hypothetical protein
VIFSKGPLHSWRDYTRGGEIQACTSLFHVYWAIVSKRFRLPFRRYPKVESVLVDMCERDLTELETRHELARTAMRIYVNFVRNGKNDEAEG